MLDAKLRAYFVLAITLTVLAASVYLVIANRDASFFFGQLSILVAALLDTGQAAVKQRKRKRKAADAFREGALALAAEEEPTK